MFRVVRDPDPVAIKMDEEVEGRKCEGMSQVLLPGYPTLLVNSFRPVYLLRTSNAIPSQSAIAITYFPHCKTKTQENLGAHTTALPLGYSEVDKNELKRLLYQSDDFPTYAHLIVAFLEIEKKKRFKKVRELTRAMQNTIHELGRDINAAEAKSPTEPLAGNEPVDIYFEVYHIKINGIEPWQEQLKMLGTIVDPARDAGLVRYLQQVVATYQHRIARCNMVLQGASLAYQMVSNICFGRGIDVGIADNV
jgi:hypothetical protein